MFFIASLNFLISVAKSLSLQTNSSIATLTESKPMVVPYYSSSIFSGNLIHGSALNKSNSIRFSCDFRVIKKSDYKSESKKFHFASNKPYFVEF